MLGPGLGRMERMEKLRRRRECVCVVSSTESSISGFGCMAIRHTKVSDSEFETVVVRKLWSGNAPRKSAVRQVRQLWQDITLAH